MTQAVLTRITPTNVAFNSIVVLVDFSDCSLPGLRVASRLAKQYGSHLHLIQLISYGVRFAVHRVPLDALAADRLAALKHLRTTSQLPELQEVQCTTEVRAGNIAEQVAAAVSQHNADLVVVGTAGASEIERSLHGLAECAHGSGSHSANARKAAPKYFSPWISNASCCASEEVFRSALCPVLTVRPDLAQVSADDLAAQSILAPVDFSPQCVNALPYAVLLAEDEGVELVLVHVTNPEPAPSVQAMLRESYESEMKLLLRDFAPFGRPPQLRVEFGDPATKILDVALNQHADIVLGVRRLDRGSQGHLPRAIASEVVRKGQRPVLTVCYR